MLHSIALNGGKGGIKLKGASARSGGQTSFGRKGGGISFGNKGIDQKYVFAGIALIVVAYVVVSLKG